MAEPRKSHPVQTRAPSPAERVRTAVAAASVATVTTYSRDPSARCLQTVVKVRGDEAGRLVVHLDPRSAAAANLVARPVASLRLADPMCGSSLVLLHGGVRRAPVAPRSREQATRPAEPTTAVAYLLEVTSARLRDPSRGREDDLVDADSYGTAEPDPLRAEAPGVLAHLRDAHASGLLDCLRRQGHPEAAWVEPRRLDRYGLEVVVVTPDAVADVRLPFPRPLTSLAQLGPGLRCALTCRCGDVG